jgi:uroporphyrinogen III methyltransferase/synthase
MADMAVVSSNQDLAEFAVLVSPNQAAGDLAKQLQGQGSRVLVWPTLDVRAPDNCQAIDEAIENLFGYDWLICQNRNAVKYFLSRFQSLGHEISELDSLRVCGVGDQAIAALDQSQVHFDVAPDQLSPQAIFDAIETYVGGHDALRGLNFLIPGAATVRCSPQEALEDAGGRCDVVTTYLTTSANDLARLAALLTGGGIDCVAFANLVELEDFAEAFDTNDLGRLLNGVPVACVGQALIERTADFGLKADVVADRNETLADAIASYFRGGQHPS